ncbi:histidinol dehydrogenase [Citricoccus muralis]|uniref:Histidinol dehydrogenase n=1 Tax=Citricoccus muralis TaxID=169134 RepID=A0A3D9LDA7_9MICC|nr:histidinol dehydrogenase [Citricoccus muralis]REE04132.1 histidinol dehydrogenase [Citricoccus muralis]
MLATTDLRGRPYDPATVLPRAETDVAAAVPKVMPILDRVRTEGARAVLDLGEQFDGIRPPSLAVPAEKLTEALESLDPEVRSALEESIDRARKVHAAQVPAGSEVDLGEGALVENRWVPVNRVGLYVPGGRAVYPSSVVMNVVPAQAAGVASLAVASPPQKDFGGLPHPVILAACALLGVDEVYAAGGAQAVAMFAYGVADDDGTRVCAPVDMVTGPGNIFVAAAKRALLGTIGIDAEAGPTEIAVLADGTADARWVAADLISQAEHDPMAGSVLITTSPELARDVVAEIERQVPGSFHEEQIRQALGGPQSGILLVGTLDEALAVADAYAAEHLEVHTVNPLQTARRVTNAGAVFVGPHSPVPLGDYSSGSNHVLPTGGSARYSSGLNTVSFLRLQQLIRYTETGLKELDTKIAALSTAEGLPAHGEAVSLRFR